MVRILGWTIFTILGYEVPYEHPCYYREYVYSPNPPKTPSIRTPEIPSFETFVSFEQTFTLLSILIYCGTKILIYILFINVFFQIKQIWLRHEKYYYYHYIHYNLQLLKGKSKLFLSKISYLISTLHYAVTKIFSWKIFRRKSSSRLSVGDSVM